MGNDFNKRLADKAAHIEDILKAFLPKEEGYARTVIEAMNYSLLAGGKRLRPMMILEAYKLFAGNDADEKVVYPFMAAMEMIHTYSLVHDDLPAMDNDEYRRGRKTTHAVYGAGMATLAGDGLLNLAYETAINGAMRGTTLSDYDGDNSNRYLAALDILAGKAGIYGMVGGQCADICAENATEIPEDEMKDTLHYIDENKTGALIEASLMIGAVIGGASAQQVSMMEKIGSNVGIAFQIQDDILDITSTSEVLGKPIGSDEKNGKSTYVSLYGMDNARDSVKKLSEEATDILDGLGFENSFLHELFNYLIYREK
ncbi:geranylgeranyl pyrophosphate synthase IspA [Butyrivibrio proteoclasticus B316]|uniref:Farnesyl diphosphate synthase n=1 Tax=Butyrivibrio proteoclasticus (strain ATCC 51982 / DSM 14932 / B316) TaxID=515622 RepID=E0S1P9_BUTPB|nr:farnesyl diphosphate synthase [Butyrivibrio proteoclasticus]ADL33724.1 geranylgeranyl pyrophosphate synthase IspA [Butyrivibrio proteoclasticus B316]